jgi:transcription-repair coupling factor (superfamily II helicase)
VALAKGQTIEGKEPAPVIVELALDAYLPVDYVRDEIERVDLYRRASGVHTLAELDDLAEELQERFGELPEPALNLLGLSRVKLLARSLGATAINYRSGTLSITGVTTTAAAPALIRKATGGVVDGREGRVMVRGSALGALELAEESLQAIDQS